MISYLRGKIKYLNQLSKKDNFFVIDVGGVGYKVLCTIKVIEKMKLEQESEVYTFHNVREDSQELYGFLTFEEVDFFKLLTGISGIGPKKALAVLEQADILSIQEAVINDDPVHLIKVAGLSKNIAEKIVVGLQGKIKDILKGKGSQTVTGDFEVIEALASLGFPTAKARQVVNQLPKELKSSDEKIKEALKMLGKK